MLDNELTCPFCGALTALKDRWCAACRRSLWVRRREVTSPKPAYRRLVMMEAAFAAGGLLLPMLLLTYVDLFVQTGSILTVAAYYRDPDLVPPGLLAAMYDVAPPNLLLFSLLPSGLAVPILLCVLSRWMPGFAAAALLGASRIVIGGIHAVTLLTLRFGSLPPDSPWAELAQNRYVGYVRAGYGSAVLVTTAIAALLLVTLINLQDHFNVEALRTLLTLDRDAKGSYLGLWLRGREYAKRKAWAIAALHLRQALLMQPSIDAYLLLAVAYRHLDQPEEVVRTLDAAEAHSAAPDRARVAALRGELATYLDRLDRVRDPERD
jgi:hypothetical protein